MSIGASPAPAATDYSVVAALEVDVHGRWDALALSEFLVPFHSFTDGLPAVALARDPAARGTMLRRPRPQGRLLGRELEVARGLAGVTIGLAATAAYLAGRELAPEAAQTMAFATVALAELLFVFSVRSPRAPAWRGPRNPALIASVVLSAAVVALLVYFTPVQDAFGTVPLGARELALVLGLAALPPVLVELAKALRRRRGRGRWSIPS